MGSVLQDWAVGWLRGCWLGDGIEADMGEWDMGVPSVLKEVRLGSWVVGRLGVVGQSGAWAGVRWTSPLPPRQYRCRGRQKQAMSIPISNLWPSHPLNPEGGR